MSTRRRTRQLLERAFDGTLDAEGYLELERLAAADPALAEEAAAQRRLVAALEGLEEPEAEPFDVEALVVRVDRAIDAEATTAPRPVLRRAAPWLALAAAGMGVAATLVWFERRSDGTGSEGGPRPDGPSAVGESGGNAEYRGTGHELVADSDGGSNGRAGTPDDAAQLLPFDLREPQRLLALGDAAEPVDPERLERAVERAAAVMSAAPFTDDARRWCSMVRTELGVERDPVAPLDVVVRRMVESLLAKDNGTDGAVPDGVDPDGVDPDGADPDGADPDGVVLTRGMAWLVADGDRRGIRRVQDTLVGVQVPGDDGERNRLAARDAWLFAAAVGDLARTVRSGDLGARDASAVAKALAGRSSSGRDEFVRDLVRGGWDRTDDAVLVALADELTGLADRMVDEVARGGARPEDLRALRGRGDAGRAVASRLEVARRGREMERLARCAESVAASAAVTTLRDAAEDGVGAAVDALLALPDAEALRAWFDLHDGLALRRRSADWERVLRERPDQVVDLARTLTSERLDALLDGLLSNGSPAAVDALMALAQRDDRGERWRSDCVTAAVELAHDVEPAALVSQLEALAGRAAASDGATLLAACFDALARLTDMEALEALCRDLFDDDVRPLDAFDRGRPGSAAMRTRLRLLLERTLNDRARA